MQRILESPLPPPPPPPSPPLSPSPPPPPLPPPPPTSSCILPFPGRSTFPVEGPRSPGIPRSREGRRPPGWQRTDREREK